MKFTRAAILTWMGIVFLCGGLLGALGHRLYMVSTVRANNSARRNPEEFRRRYTEELKSRLHLTEDQLAKLETVLDQTRVQVREARATLDPEMKKIRDEQERQIRVILSDDQEAEWARIQQERAARRTQRNNQRTTPAAQ